MAIAPVRPIPAGSGLRWLRMGWRDMRRVPVVSLAHGLVLMVAALVILWIGFAQATLLAGAFSGFVLVAPALLVGLYAQSRALARGEPTGFATVATAWRRTRHSALRVGLLLALAGTAWVLVSSLIVAAASVGDGGVSGYLRFFAGREHPVLFWLWLMAGAVGAALVFAATAISLPMLVDRDMPIRQAVLTSFAAVGNHPVAMGVWAALIMALTLVAMASVIGLLVLVPVLGHASWHAYQDLAGDKGSTV